jgi:dolichol-phosphate mannosyltransferase
MVATYKVVLAIRLRASQKLLKFVKEGFIGFIVNFLFLRVFRSVGLPEPVAWLLSTELAIMSNFTLNNIWTFSSTKITGLKHTLLKFGQFNLTSVGALVIQSIAGPIGVGLVGAQYDFIVLGVVVAFLVLPYNYLMYTLVIWRKK